MTTANDNRILKLRELIKQKRIELGSEKRFVSLTNCSLKLFGAVYNLHVMEIGDMYALLAILNNMPDNVTISGYTVSDWKTDIKNKLMVISYTAKRNNLDSLESQLEKLLSQETKQAYKSTRLQH